jgi:NADPH:quinone reductase
MKAAVIYQNGAPDVFRYEEVPDPSCGPHEIVLQVEAISIEGGDTLNRFRGELSGSPHIVGYQAAGTIIEIGSDVTTHTVGQRVTTINAFGSHAERRAVPARTAWVIPDGLEIGKAAAIPVAVGTAHECLFDAGRLQAGETVLIHAGASALGIAAIQLAKKAGARVLATASSDARLEKLRRFGLDVGINYVTHDTVAEVMRATDKRGVDLVVDSVGGTTLQSSILSLAYRGRISMVGAAGREPMRVDVSTMMHAQQQLTGVFLGAEIVGDRLHNLIQSLIEQAGRGEFEVVIDRTFPLGDAAAAHAYIESRQAVGRVLLVPDQFRTTAETAGL